MVERDALVQVLDGDDPNSGRELVSGTRIIERWTRRRPRLSAVPLGALQRRVYLDPMRFAMRVFVVITLPAVAFSWIGPSIRAASMPDCGQPRLLDSLVREPACVPTAIEVAAVSLALIAIAAAGYAMFRS